MRGCETEDSARWESIRYFKQLSVSCHLDWTLDVNATRQYRKELMDFQLRHRFSGRYSPPPPNSLASPAEFHYAGIGIVFDRLLRSPVDFGQARLSTPVIILEEVHNGVAAFVRLQDGRSLPMQGPGPKGISPRLHATCSRRKGSTPIWPPLTQLGRLPLGSPPAK